VSRSGEPLLSHTRLSGPAAELALAKFVPNLLCIYYFVSLVLCYNFCFSKFLF
jgi:hypothetical protein